MSRPDSRQLAIRTATRLFQRQGYHGTGLSQIILESGSPKGSFYHHFPKGKEELALEAIMDMRKQVLALFQQAAKGITNEPQYIKRLISAVEQWLQQSDFLEGCPVAGFAVEGAQYPTLREACNDTYSTWCNQLAEVLSTFNYNTRQALERAHLIVASVDGAILMSRVAQDLSPLRRIGRALTATA